MASPPDRWGSTHSLAGSAADARDRTKTPAATRRADETFDDVRIEIAVAGEGLSDEDADVLAAGAKRSPVWTLLHLAHDMAPVVSVERTPPADRPIGPGGRVFPAPESAGCYAGGSASSPKPLPYASRTSVTLTSYASYHSVHRCFASP